MEMGAGLSCNGCGSTDVIFDPVKRLLICNQCGKQEFYSRATLNRNGKVIYCKENAVSQFTEARYADARHFALDVLNISVENIPARFIIAFYNDVEGKEAGQLKEFFTAMKAEALDYDEIRDLQKLIAASLPYLSEYEKDIITISAANMQADEDKKELCEFIDKMCPYFIAKRSSSGFLDPEMAEMYGDLAEHCDIPKTCFSLLKSIETNPDSPYKGNTFAMRTQTRYFYENFVVPVGKIIERMGSPEWKQKFSMTYQQKNRKFQSDAGMM
ncbi:MAG: hypothetical protein IKQ27_05110 [Lachnospiraceae bacterium]|nr:hypothetical protein [Lachnospiraceae bacterium]